MNASFTLKKLTSRVRPGVLLTRANFFRRMSRLSSDDLPTLDRPANAISGSVGSGRHPPALAIPPMNSSVRMTSGSLPSDSDITARSMRRDDGNVRRVLGPREGDREHFVHRLHGVEAQAVTHIG